MSPYSILFLLVVIPLAAWFGWDFLSANRKDAELMAWLAAPFAVIVAGLALIRWAPERQRKKIGKPRKTPPHYRQLLHSLRRHKEPEAAVLKAVLSDLPHTWEEYRLHCVARHAQGQRRVDRRFVRLSLLMDTGSESEGERWQENKEQQFQDLHDLLDARPDDQALVLLGSPGCGKSTLMHRLEYDLALAALQSRKDTPPLTWVVPLNACKKTKGQDLPPPGDWLAGRWQEEYPHLPPLERQLKAGLWLLLDGLNELPHHSRDAYAEQVDAWRAWLTGLPRNCRALFSCRSLDYSEPLSVEGMTVPHVRFRELDDGQVQAFLEEYLPEKWQTLWEDLRDSPRLEMERTPFYLKLEVEQYRDRGRPPAGPAELFSGFVWQALRREVAVKHDQRFANGQLLSLRDQERINGPDDWQSAPHQLPEEGSLLPGLSNLAYGMQLDEGGGTYVRSTYARALELIGGDDAVQVLEAAGALALLDQHKVRDQVYFVHQLFQEYFASRRLAHAPDYSLLSSHWRVSEVQPPLAGITQSLAYNVPLPPLPATGWEETARLAAALTDDPAGFIEPLAQVNLPLAGRCAAQPGVRLDESRRRALSGRLIERSRHPEADLRARIAAGLALGELGDTRLESHQGPHGAYQLSPRVVIPGKVYSLGSDEGEGEPDERPRFSLRLDDFELAQFPVTNAEWRCFMQAGGYANADWWETEDARAWRLGKLSMEQEKSRYRDVRLNLQGDFEGATAGLTPTAIEQAQSWVDTDHETFETWLSDWLPEGELVREPLYWRDPRYNNPAQPVVGVCWYEARAYCCWLSEQAGRRFSLPGEAQWEVACRGSERREYAWEGDYDPMKANVYDTHLRNTTPVGIFPAGDTPQGLMDMTGNVWEWTRDRFEGYPMLPDDGRGEATGRQRRVLRGGAFLNSRQDVRAASRNGSDPAHRHDNVGFRVCCELSPIVKPDR